MGRLRVDWDNLHFERADKVRYRKHLTAGIVLSTLATIVGVAWHNDLLTHVSAITNCVTSFCWVWE